MSGQHRGRRSWIRWPALPQWLPDWIHRAACRPCRADAHALELIDQLDNALGKGEV